MTAGNITTLSEERVIAQRRSSVLLAVVRTCVSACHYYTAKMMNLDSSDFFVSGSLFYAEKFCSISFFRTLLSFLQICFHFGSFFVYVQQGNSLVDNLASKCDLQIF